MSLYLFVLDFCLFLFLPTMQTDSQHTKAVTQQNTGIQYCYLDLQRLEEIEE